MEEKNNGSEYKYIKLKIEDAQEILNYLQNQKYVEVHELIPKLINAEKIEG